MVAPIVRNSPLAKAGLSILEASIEPSEDPAPIKVWSSSIKRMIRPSCFFTSFKTALRRSSNSPLNFAPATNEPKSKLTISLFFKFSGTSPAIMRCAKPSTIAVFPVPASPIKTGLFFVRRNNTCIKRRTSISLPTTGSNFS